MTSQPVSGRLRSRSAKLRAAPVGALAIPVVVIAIVAVTYPLLPLSDAGAQSLADGLRPPAWARGGSWAHPLGTDQLGRDVLARLAAGARLTLVIALLGTIASAIPGIMLGMLAGYKGGCVDAVISRLVDAQLALPYLLLAIGIQSVGGRSLTVLILVLALIGWAPFTRVVRAEVLSLRTRPFVLGLRCAGVSTPRLLMRHILPNIAGTVLVMATLQIGTVILAESALSFLGLGVVSPQISWGTMLAEGRDTLVHGWWVAAVPGAAISLLLLSTNLLGDALRTRFDPGNKEF